MPETVHVAPSFSSSDRIPGENIWTRKGTTRFFSLSRVVHILTMGSVSGTYKREEGCSPQNTDPVVVTLNMDDTCEVHLLAKWPGVFDLKVVSGTWMKCASNRVASDEAMVCLCLSWKLMVSGEGDLPIQWQWFSTKCRRWTSCLLYHINVCAGMLSILLSFTVSLQINKTKQTFSSIDGDDLDDGPDPYSK